MERFLNLLKKKNIKNPASLTDISNIKGFLQGHLRAIQDEFGMLALYKQEQAAWRLTQANKECISKDQCIECGCFPMKDKVLEDRGCKANCYGDMLSQLEWSQFKFKNNINL